LPVYGFRDDKLSSVSLVVAVNGGQVQAVVVVEYGEAPVVVVFVILVARLIIRLLSLCSSVRAVLLPAEESAPTDGVRRHADNEHRSRNYISLYSMFGISIADSKNESDCVPQLEPHLKEEEKDEKQAERLVDIVSRHSVTGSCPAPWPRKAHLFRLLTDFYEHQKRSQMRRHIQ